MTISKFRASEALRSFGSLNTVINGLTEEEVLACLELEVASQRRASILSRLISRAVRLNQVSYTSLLKEKFHG
jgi:hypothetical protein